MAGTVELKATFQARWHELALADTLAGLRADSTITPETISRPSDGQPQTLGLRPTWTRPDAGELPRISVSFPSEASTPPTASQGADLEVVALLGEGGMGQVHLARQHSLHREVALKTARQDRGASAAALLREAVIAGSLEHPGIVPVHALGVDSSGAPVLVMKRVEGVEWRALVTDEDHPAWAHRPGDRLTAHVEILIQVCQAVHFAHSRQVVHRDIKPENVMLGEYGEVYLVDWGVAARLEDGRVKAGDGLVGSPAYMAPEMVAGRDVDPRTDVYLLGATLHEVLTGRFRHEGETLQEVLLSAFCSEEVVYDEAVPAELAQLCCRCTARDPEERPPTALALRDALAAFLRHRGSSSLVHSAVERLTALETLMDTASEETPTDLKRAYQLASECRFGLAQALEIWPENAGAKHALVRCLERMVRLELLQGHIAAAAALTQEMEQVPESLKEAMRIAERKAAKERTEHRRLKAMAKDLDAGEGASQRGRALAILSGSAVAITLFIGLLPSAARLRPGVLLVAAIFTQVIVVSAIFFWRRDLMRTAFNRRLMGAMVLAGFALITHRVFAMIASTPTPRVLVTDSLLLATITAMLSLTLARGFWVVTLVFLGAAVFSFVFPEQSPAVFGIGVTLSLPVVSWALSAHSREEERRRDAPAPPSRVE